MEPIEATAYKTANQRESLVPESTPVAMKIGNATRMTDRMTESNGGKNG